jgi:hypothetical protein
MDSTVIENKPWIQKERTALEPNGILFRNFVVNAKKTKKNIKNIIDSILTLPKPIVVHHWSTTNSQSMLFRKIYFEKTSCPQTNLATHGTETF